MKKIRILLLDNEITKTYWKYYNWSAAGFELEIIYLPHHQYYASNANCEQIRELTSQHKVDLVIIGNNMGAGLIRARFVHVDLLPMTMVVWNDYRESETIPYAEVGISHFGRRPEILTILKNLLGISNHE